MTRASRAARRPRFGLLFCLAALLFAAPALSPLAWGAAPSFPLLTGRVVDGANILSPQIEAELTAKLAALETATKHQLVVATLADLQGYEIEEYGNQLFRAWGVGQRDVNDGVLFLIAPAERKVRVEVGYGMEGVLTDALSSVILQTKVLPRFKDGDMPGGVVAGTDALIEQLSLDAPEAAQRIASAESEAASDEGFDPQAFIFIVVLVLWLVFGAMRGRRRGGFGWIAPVVFGGGSGTHWSDRDSGGGSWGGGGGFSGGGGSSGGGGASGSW
jgi:uncharacterized protein